MSQPQGHRSITFDDVAQVNHQYMEQAGITASDHSVNVCVMQMMSTLGELAALSFRSTTSLTPFEREEVTSVLGKMSVSLFTLGECFEVSLGEAAMEALNNELMRRASAGATTTRGVRKSGDGITSGGTISHGQASASFQTSAVLQSTPPKSPSDPAVRASKHESTAAAATGPESTATQSQTPFTGGGLLSPIGRVAGNQNPMFTAATNADATASTQSPGAAGRAVERMASLPYPADTFHRSVNAIVRGTVTGAQILDLGLTFSVPEGDRVVELVNDGMQIPVSASNVNEFLRLVEEFKRSHVAGGRVHRTESIRRIAVTNELPCDTADFSPSHFKHGLFAPFEKKAAVYVDYDDGERILPPFLRKGGSGSTSTVPAVPGSSSTPQTPYMAAVLAGDVATLRHFIQCAKNSPSALDTYGVTFCVPSMLEPLSTMEEKKNGIHALYPNSSLQRVTAGTLNLFLALVRQYLD